MADPSARGQTLATAVATGERIASVILLVMVLGLTFAQVVARFVFNSPFFWTEELARYGYVWLTFVAAVAATADRSHITVQLFESRLPPWGRVTLNTVALALVCAACLVLLVGSWPWLQMNPAGASAAMGIPNTVFYGVVWLAFVAMAAHSLAGIVTGLREHRANGDASTHSGGSAL